MSRFCGIWLIAVCSTRSRRLSTLCIAERPANPPEVVLSRWSATRTKVESRCFGRRGERDQRPRATAPAASCEFRRRTIHGDTTDPAVRVNIGSFNAPAASPSTVCRHCVQLERWTQLARTSWRVGRLVERCALVAARRLMNEVKHTRMSSGSMR
jgi:superfamily II helicase